MERERKIKRYQVFDSRVQLESQNRPREEKKDPVQGKIESMGKSNKD